MHAAPPDERTAAKYLNYWHGRDLRLEPHRFPRLTSRGLFGNDRPLEIDFGCGTGTLACSRALQHPAVNFLGIDKSQKPLFCAVRDAAEHGLDNARFIRGDFCVMLPLLEPCTVSAAYYLFPNPPQDYHKERANALRRTFLEEVHKALVPGGRFHFATDAPSFFECMADIIGREPRFMTLDARIDEWDLTTRYRQLWEEHRREVRSIAFEKT